MNGFKYDSPLIKLLTTMANMLIVSFYWFLCSLLIVTIIPASAALYYTCVKVVFSDKSSMGVTKTFFDSFKGALKPGVLLSIVCLIALFFCYTGIDTGLQIYKLNNLGLAYLILGIVICVVFAAGLIYIPAVISHFDMDLIGAIRLALYLSSINLFQTAWFVLLFAALIYTVGVFPFALIIFPALYCDLIRVGIERKIDKFIEDNHLSIDKEETNNKEKDEEISIVDLEKNLEKKKHG